MRSDGPIRDQRPNLISAVAPGPCSHSIPRPLPLQLGVLELHEVGVGVCAGILKVECGSVLPPLAPPPGPELGHLFGLLLAAAVAVPPGLQPGHQAGQQQAGGQDAEDAGEAVQFQGASVRVGAGVGAQVAAAGARPPLLLHDVQVAFLLQL